MPDVRFLAVLLLAAAALARADDTTLRGVWRGTLGKSAVVACFDGARSGRYYYEAHRTSIPLEADENGPDWIEGDYHATTGRWRDWRRSGDELEATWSKPEGKAVQPIRLRRIGDIPVEASCDGGDVPAYEAPRRAATILVKRPLVQGEDKVGVPGFIDLAVPGDRIEGPFLHVLQLEADDVGARNINSSLRAMLDEAIAQYYECRNFGGQGGYDLEADSIEHNDDRWLAVGSTVRFTCGGPYPGWGYEVTTFDRRSGDEVATSAWLVSEDHELPPALRAVIAGRAFPRDAKYEFASDREHDDECRDTWLETGYFQVWPEEDGLGFWPDLPHVIQACSDAVVVPRQALEPFLTDEGRAALAPDPATR